jgi:transposase
MIVFGADTHKQSHTLAAVSEATGRVLADRTVRATRRSFDDLLVWARGVEGERVWAIEDCRHVSGALERFLLVRGERVVRVPPKLMAGARSSAREPGKSDAIDAVTIARAALREGLESMPIAQLAGRELDVRLLVDHRERLVAQRTRLINDLRWGLHDLWPELEIPPRALISARWHDLVGGRLARASQTTRVRIARDELRRQADRRDRRRPALRKRRQARPAGRIRADPRLLGAQRSPPPRPRRQPPTQLRAAPPGRQQGPSRPRQRRLPGTQTGPRQNPPRSAALPQALPRPPRLAPLAAHSRSRQARPIRPHPASRHDPLQHALQPIFLT